MKITLVCNCGLLIEAGGAALLIDAPHGKLPPFGQFAPQALQALLAAQPPYDHLAGVCFTHRHADHYDAAAVERLRAADCDYIQGYIWGKPQEHSTAVQLIGTQASQLQIF